MKVCLIDSFVYFEVYFKVYCKDNTVNFEEFWIDYAVNFEECWIAYIVPFNNSYIALVSIFWFAVGPMDLSVLLFFGYFEVPSF